MGSPDVQVTSGPVRYWGIWFKSRALSKASLCPVLRPSPVQICSSPFVSHRLLNKLHANYRNFWGKWPKFLLHKLQQLKAPNFFFFKAPNFIQNRGQGSHLCRKPDWQLPHPHKTFTTPQWWTRRRTSVFMLPPLLGWNEHAKMRWGVKTQAGRDSAPWRGPRVDCPEWECVLRHGPSIPTPICVILVDGPPSTVLVIDSSLQLVL